MVSRRDVERVSLLHSDDGILSAYINLDPRLAFERHQAEARFRSACVRFAHTAPEQWLPVLEREKERVLRYLREMEPNGRGIVIFSSEPAGIWEVFRLDVMVPNWVTVDTVPHTSVLARVIDEYPRLAVVMLNGEDARIYLAEQRRERQVAAVHSEIPGRHKQGGWSQARYQRHVEFHGQQHLKRVAEEMEDLYYTRPFQRLVLVGVDTVVHEFEEMLSEPVARRVIGRLPADFKQESDEEILERVGTLVEEDERSTEAALVNQVLEYAYAGGKGAVGVDDTLEEIVEGRVDTLVIADGVAAEGSLCPKCGYMAARAFDVCPLCETPAEHLEDVIDYAAERVLLSSGNVNVVFGPARDDLMARGGIGALLRY